MKVIHIMWSLEFGGIERLVLDLCQEQLKNGLFVSVLVGNRRGQMVESFESSGIKIINAKLKSGFDPGWLKFRRCEDPLQTADIVHMHSYSPTFSKWVKLSRKPVEPPRV